MSKIDNKRIARNSVMLYIRSLLLMLITLYTSRIVLNALGESNYGVYSVVGGIVILFSFINSALTGTTQRFMNVAMGRDDSAELRKVFSASIKVHIAICIVVILLSETIGLWFLNSVMRIPSDAKVAAHWVLQFSIATTAIGILSAPYNAAIISHEKMSVFAYFSLLEGILKTLVAFIISNVGSNRLIWYAALLFAVSVFNRMVYNIYCIRHFDECKKIGKGIDRKFIKQYTGFSIWTLFDKLGFAGSSQGFSMIVNYFFGTVANAALSIANQVNAAAFNMIEGFLHAVRPQIMKSYAAGEINEMRRLIIRSSRLSMLLTALFVLPISLEINFILNIWLVEVPQYTQIFTIIILLTSLVNSSWLIINAAQEATGKIKYYYMITILVSIIYLLASIVIFTNGLPPYFGMSVYLAVSVFAQIARLIFVHISTGLSLKNFAIDVIGRGLLCIVLSLIIPLYIKYHYPGGTVNSILVISSTIISFCLSTFFLGLTKNERSKILHVLTQKIRL